MGSARFNEQTYYEILEISPGAAPNEIHLAYQRARATYSPDSTALLTMFSESEARELLDLIEEAFETLSNQARRRKYDASLVAHQTQTQDLPDVDVKTTNPTPATHSNVESNPGEVKIISKKETVPSGFARTKFGVYEVDPNFEKEFKSTEDVDGKLLLKVRLYKQMNLEQISNETRISKSYLSAVETNDYQALPAGVFVRGFVVQMARVLGMDEQRTANLYMKKYKASGRGQ
jgi:hypothetical protein